MAKITLTFTGEQATRIGAAFGKRLELGRDANETEYKQELVRITRRIVEQYERDAHEEAYVPQPDVEII
jgi:hypothetical protein